MLAEAIAAVPAHCTSSRWSCRGPKQSAHSRLGCRRSVDARTIAIDVSTVPIQKWLIGASGGNAVAHFTARRDE